MYYKCCVDNCGSKRPAVVLHRFPASETGLKKWVKFINSERLRNLNDADVRKGFLVCHKHFERRFITEKSRIRLGAHPTLFSEAEIETGVPSVTHEDEADAIAHVMFDHSYERRNLHEDHTYCKVNTSESAGLHPPLGQLPFVREIENQLPVVQEIENQLPVLSESSLQQRPALREITNMPQVSTIPGASSGKLLSHPTSTQLVDLGQQVASSEATGKRSKHRKRLIRKVADLPPAFREIYQQYKKSVKQLDFMKRAKRALAFRKSQSFDKLTSKVNPLAKQIIWMQITQSHKKLKGRRFTDEEKMISLSIMKQSPKAYRFLQKIFILPSRNTLGKMTASLDIQPGVNDQIFDAIKDQVNKWSENKKYCSIIFDEISLEPGVEYDKCKDSINGFVHLNQRQNNFADHALAFMLRGAIHKWQQPVAYYFCEGATKKDDLKVIIKDIVHAVIGTGLLPVALVCDQGQSFQSALKALREDTRREQIMSGKQIDDIITINGHNLSIVFDPPHLIKGIRNNFLTKNMKFDQKVCKWDDIVDVYNTDCGHAEMRLLHKLTDNHVIPEKINKMKVKNCTRVLSKTVAKALSYTSQFSHYADGREVSATIKNTAEAVSFFDDLFDSTNGASLGNKKSGAKPLRRAVTESSPHHQFWREAIQKLETIKFIDARRGEVSVPSLQNWITTLKSFMRLWQFFKNKNIKIMRPRYFNSDPVENFFGQVRAYNFRNNDPNCHNFTSTFKSLLITRFIKFHSAGFNCEEDAGAQIINIKKLFQHKTNKEPVTSAPPHNISVPEEDSIETQARRERLTVHARAYTAGWVVRRIINKFKCQKCAADLTVTEAGSIHSWISRREYSWLKNKGLTYPSERAVRCFGTILKESNGYLEHKPHKNNISREIKDHILSKDPFDFLTCAAHKNDVIEYFLTINIKLAVFNWCNVINKILKGSDISRLSSSGLNIMQEKAFNKYKKKLKNKK